MDKTQQLNDAQFKFHIQYVCVCVCVCLRERGTERERMAEKDWENKEERGQSKKGN
jgi:hypothetical protein